MCKVVGGILSLSFCSTNREYSWDPEVQGWVGTKPSSRTPRGGKTKWKSLIHVQLFVTPWTIQSLEFSRPEYWSGQPIPSPGDLPYLGIKLGSPALKADSLPTELQGKPKNTGMDSLSLLQGIFPTQELNWGLLHCRQILYQLSYQGSPKSPELLIYFFNIILTYLHSIHSFWIPPLPMISFKPFSSWIIWFIQRFKWQIT